MTTYDLPELAALSHRQSLIRIPPEQDIPLTGRVRRLIDTAAFRRLSRISQLGLVAQVYPAAHHTRFEHSLGVYRLALLYLSQLQHDSRFSATVTLHDAEVFVLSSLVHDLGHWPYCHPIEDLALEGVPSHEQLAEHFLKDDEVLRLLKEDWATEPATVMRMLSGPHESVSERLLASLLSGPIDVDKMDYLPRDSLHAGVPYGCHFDRQRLIGSLCVNAEGDGLAITRKGRTAAEMMVFARYVMFSEVYWHHAVRSATAMLQRSFYRLISQLELDSLFQMEELPFQQVLLATSDNTPVADHVAGLFGPRRQLFKRWVEYSLLDNAELYTRLARQPYAWLCQLTEALAGHLSTETGQLFRADDILIDVPPLKLEVEFNVPVYDTQRDEYWLLGELSPVVHTLAHTQFDDFVKRVRLFVHPDKVGLLPAVTRADEFIQAALRELGE